MHKGLIVLAIVANHAVQAVQELLGLHSKKDLGQVQCLQKDTVDWLKNRQRALTKNRKSSSMFP